MMWSRVMVCLIAAAGTARAQELQYEEIRVTSRVVVFVPNERGAGNVTAVFGDDAVVVIDAGGTPSGATAILDAIRRHSDRPVTTLVLTHWHDDHVWGTQAFRDRFPAVDIVAHPATMRGFAEQAVPNLAANISRLEQRIAQRDSILAAGVESGTPLTPERRAALEGRQRAFRDLLDQLRTVRPVEATVPLADSLIVRSGTVEIRLWFPGRGHTAGDLVAYVPSERVLVAGDLLTFPFPAAAEAYVSEWSATLRRLAALDAGYVIPGHGPVLRDVSSLDTVIALFDTLTSAARAAYAEGLSVAEAVEHVDLGPLRDSFAGSDPSQQRAFERFFLRPALASLYREFTTTDQ